MIRALYRWLGWNEQYVSEACRRHYVLQAALAQLEPPEPEPWHEPHEKVKPIRREES